MRVLQLVAEARPADAVTDQAMRIARALSELGHDAQLGADRTAPELAAHFGPAPALLPERWDLVVDHYSIGADYHRELARRGHRRWLLYHNITPARLLAPWAPAIAARCAEGRERLAALLPGYELALAYSSFSAAELAHARVELLPMCVEPPAEAAATSASLRAMLAGRGPLLLFVGRLAPQKNHVGLLRLLRRLRGGAFPRAELLVVGDARGFEGYEQALLEAAGRLGVAGAVHLAGKVPVAELWSYYRLADLFCCLSLHEGFCVPLVEAFLAGLPVVAAPGGAVAETLGDAGLLAESGSEREAAELCEAALGEPALAGELRSRGRRRAESYSYAALRSRLAALLGHGEGGVRNEE
jgi:glycosyltransferase involved in cell wall biosynthesis